MKGRVFHSVNPLHYSSAIKLQQVSRYLVRHRVSEVQVLDTGWKHILKKLEKKIKVFDASCKKNLWNNHFITQSFVLSWLWLWLIRDEAVLGNLHSCSLPGLRSPQFPSPTHLGTCTSLPDFSRCWSWPVVVKNHQHISNPEIKELKGNADPSNLCSWALDHARPEQADSFRYSITVEMRNSLGVAF